MRPSTAACILLVSAASPALAAPIIALQRDNVSNALVNAATIWVRNQIENQSSVTTIGKCYPYYLGLSPARYLSSELSKACGAVNFRAR
jgi:hypothetical protein